MTDRYAAYERLKFDTPGDRILRITMDAPGRLNAADETMHDELGRIWKDVEADPDVSVAILCGAGKAFSAGGDFDMIDEMIDLWNTLVERRPHHKILRAFDVGGLAEHGLLAS